MFRTPGRNGWDKRSSEAGDVLTQREMDGVASVTTIGLGHVQGNVCNIETVRSADELRWKQHAMRCQMLCN